MKTYLSTDYANYNEFVEALKPDVAENIQFPISAVHKTLGACTIKSARPTVQDNGVDFIIEVAFENGETKLYSFKIVVVQKEFISISDDLKTIFAEYLDSMAVVHSELVLRAQNERRQALEASLKAKEEAKQKAKELTREQKRLAKLNESCATEYFNRTFEPATRYELLGWIAKHLKSLTPTVPKSMMDWFTKKFGSVENVSVVDDSKLTTGGHSMKWNVTFKATFDSPVPKALEYITNKSGKVINDVSFVYDLISKYDFKFGKEQDFDLIKSHVAETYLGQYETGFAS